MITKVQIINDLNEIANHAYSTLNTVSCSDFTDAGMSNHINIYNKCDKNIMITVRWIGNNYQKDLKYRLRGYEKRLIESIGLAGSIIDENQWDLNYGADASSYVSIRKEDRGQAGTLWILKNSSFSYICYTVKVLQKGIDGNGYGIANPASDPIMSNTNVWHTLPGDTAQVFLISANFDPD